MPANASEITMRHLDLTLPSPAENLACDEALLDWCESGEGVETLRFWESPVPFIVVGGIVGFVYISFFMALFAAGGASQ